MNNPELTTKGYWENTINNEVGTVESVVFSDLFKKYIRRSTDRALEIGVVPGRFLAYISRNFGHFPEGIDYLKDTVKITSDTFMKNGIKKFKIYKADFFKWKQKRRYSLVCSFGFIEHFSNPEEVIRRHLDLLKQGGTVIIGVPSFRGLRYLLSYLTDRETLLLHNLEVMSLDFYRKIAKNFDLDVKFLGFYGNFEYNWCNNSPSFVETLIYYPFKIIEKIIKLVPAKNKFLSPYIVFIAEKKK